MTNIVIKRIVPHGELLESLRQARLKRSKARSAVLAVVMELQSKGNEGNAGRVTGFSLSTVRIHLKRLQAEGIGKGLEVISRDCGEEKPAILLAPAKAGSAAVADREDGARH